MHFKTEILLQICKYMPRYIISAIFPLPHVFPYKSAGKNTLNATSPLPFGHSPIAQTCVISLQDLTSFARGEVGTRIDRDISLLMPLRLRGGFATECHAFSY